MLLFTDLQGPFIRLSDFPSFVEAIAYIETQGGGTLLLSEGTVTSPYQNSLAVLPDEVNAMTVDNVTIWGMGRPETNADDTAMVGGSIIQGSFFVNANNFRIFGCGVDSGAAFCIANYAGVPQEGLVFYDVEQGGGPVVPSYKGCQIENFSVLCHKTGKAGDASDVHAILVENYVGVRISNIKTRKGGAGTVVKSKNVIIDGVDGSGHFKYTVLVKSEDYQDASFIHIKNIIASNLGVASPDILDPTDYDTSGVIVQASSANSTAIIIDGVLANGCIQAVLIQGLAANECTDINVTNVYGQNILDALVTTSNIVPRIVMTNISGRVANAGIVIGEDTVFASIDACQMYSINGYSLQNSGIETNVYGFLSDSPAATHVRIIDGNLIYNSNEFRTYGPAAFLTTIGGTITDVTQQVATSGTVFLDADFTTNSGTPVTVDVTDFNWIPEEETVYEITCNLLISSSDIACGARPGIKWPSGGVLSNVYTIRAASGAASEVLYQGSGTGEGIVGNSGAAVADVPYMCSIVGQLTMGVGLVGQVQITMCSETGANVTMKEGSTLNWRILS